MCIFAEKTEKKVISKNKIKLIHSLERKKNRVEEGLLLAEGPKLMDELLGVWTPAYIAATEEWLELHKEELRGVECDQVTQEELNRASLLRTPQQVIGLFPLPHEQCCLAEMAAGELCLALDGVQDPGNMGTIVRLADWFGIRHVFCSPDTVDVFSPKAIQATMGAIFRVPVRYTDIPDVCREAVGWGGRVYGTFLDGDNMYSADIERRMDLPVIIVIGNESNGISPEVASAVTDRLFIPPYPADDPGSESLNAAVATAIVVNEFRRGL